MKRQTLTVDEAAEVIGVSRVSLYNAIKSGEFKPVLRIGKRILIPRAALEKMLSNNGGNNGG